MKTRRGKSLFWTIAATFLLTAIVGTLLQALVVSAVLRPLEDRDARSRAELAVNAVAGAIASAPEELRGAELDSLLARHRESVRPAWILFRASDGTVVTSRGRLPGPPPLPRPGDARDPRRFETLASRAVVRGTSVLGQVEVVRRTMPRGALGIFEPGATILLVPVTLLVSGFAGIVLVRLLVRRLGAVELLATRVAEGDLSVRIGDGSGDEIGRITEQLDRMTERLAENREQLLQNERERRQLFADITHELATPLTSIRGYAETLLDPAVPVSSEERTHYVRGLLEESRRMDLLIRDLFELARLEAGATSLVRESLDWSALCRNTLERFEPRFRKAGLTVSWNGPERGAWIEADGRRMEQVLENLLVNALRYVPSGGHVEVRLEPAAAKAGRHRLTVSDDGPGIPPEELPLLFGRFYRSATSRRGAEPGQDLGSGLGLAIVREIVERHGGTARAEARAPRGLRISIEIPALDRG